MFKILFLAILFIQSADGSPSQKLQSLFDDHWEYTLRTNPLFATGQGDHRFDDRLPDSSPEAIEQHYQKEKEFLNRLKEIPRKELSEEDRVNYDVFKRQLENSIRGYELNRYLLPLNGWWDYHASFADLANDVPLETVEDYENYLSRLAAFPKYNEGFIERMRTGIEKGFVRPQIVFDDYIASIEALIHDNPEESRLFDPFEEFPADFSSEEQEHLANRAREVLREYVIPEFQRLRDFLDDEYIPNTAESIAITDLPGGEEYYQYLVENYTTMEITADEIHQMGLDEVRRIRNEMMKIVEEEGFGDDFDGFVEFLRTDPQFYAETPQELLEKTAYILKTIDGKLPELFKTLPRLPYGIEPIPDYLAPRTATAYYSRGAADGTRAGTYAVNTYDLDSRPLYEIPALSLHEAVPGHHLQIALQQELDDLPKFRTVAGFTAFTEG